MMNKSKDMWDVDSKGYEEPEDTENDTDGEEDDGLGLFDGKNEPTREIVLKMYDKGIQFNNSINLYENVKRNENFYLGKQWEGAKTMGLPTVTLNFIKSDVGYVTSILTSEKIKATANVLNKSIRNEDAINTAHIMNDAFEEINERVSLSHMIRSFVRSAAVDGDGAIYVRWNPDLETGELAKGGIELELVDNTRVIFGNPANEDVQSQEYIMILKREPARLVKRRARDNGIEDWSKIKSDWEDSFHVDDNKLGHDDNTTVIMFFWKDDDTGEVNYYEITKYAEVCKPKNILLKEYPLVWLPWDLVKDCYHGQAMTTGLIVNQMAVNKGASMELVTIERIGLPRIAYDGTKLDKITNQAGGAIKLKAGGNVNEVIKVIDGASINPNNHQFFGWMWDKSNEAMGVNASALGNVRPDNTSAIIANQRAGQTPHENTKERAENSIKELHKIYIEYMKYYYGRRLILVPAPPQAQAAVEMARMNPQFANIPDLKTMAVEFDFSSLQQYIYDIKIDVGSSSYFSEIQQSTTLQNAAQVGLIDPYLFWKCLPNGYVNNQQEIVNYYESQHEQQQQIMAAQPPIEPNGFGVPEAKPDMLDHGQKTKIPESGGGYSALQREVTQGKKET